MSADIETMMYAGALPWHGIGTSLPAEVTAQEAIVLAGLDWDVRTAPIETADQERTSIDDYRVTKRVQDQTILGIVRKGYRPIQNRDAFRMFDGVVGKDRAIYHTAGSLRGGSRVWILAKLPGVITIGGVDDVERYLLLSNAHDGTRPLQMLFTPVRVVCSNTLGVALSRRSGDTVDEDGKERWDRWAPRVTVRQNVKAAKHMKEAERVIAVALRYYEKFGDFAGFLAAKRLSGHQAYNVVREVFPADKEKEESPTVVVHRSEVLRLWDEGKGHTGAIAGSAWALFNAFAEYADHGYAISLAKSPADRSYSIWMGGARGLKQRATKSLLTLLQ